MSVTKTPGLKAQHMHITDNCRATHGGFLAALDEAYRRMRENVERQFVPVWERRTGRGDEFHLVLTTDLAKKDEETP